MTTACSFWIWSVAQSMLLKLKSSAERVKGRALVVSGVRGNRNPRVLGTFAPKVPPPRTAEKKYIITYICVWYKDKFEFRILLFYVSDGALLVGAGGCFQSNFAKLVFLDILCMGFVRQIKDLDSSSIIAAKTHAGSFSQQLVIRNLLKIVARGYTKTLFASP